jgi:hypothetical protein
MQLQMMLNASVPHLFANAFVIAMTPADMIVGMIGNNAVACTVNLSYIAAKTLADELSKALRDYEKAAGQPVKLASDINDGLQRVRGDPNAMV